MLKAPPLKSSDLHVLVQHSGHLNRRCCTNSSILLHICRLGDTNLCERCINEIEDFKHMLWNCRFSKSNRDGHKKIIKNFQINISNYPIQISSEKSPKNFSSQKVKQFLKISPKSPQKKSSSDVRHSDPYQYINISIYQYININQINIPVLRVESIFSLYFRPKKKLI